MSTVIADPPVPPEAFERFAGRWIAIRARKVVASADSLEELQRDASVRETDMLALVPDPKTHFYRWRA